MTARNLIKGSLRLIGVLASGETPSSDESNDALSRLNSMIKSWNIEGLMVHKVTREEFALVSGQASRTMGTGGNFNTTRPTKVTQVTTEENGIEIAVDIITAEEWAAIPDKATTADSPSCVYIEGTYPLETINIWPVPSSTNNIVIYSHKTINADLALSDSLSLPPGYEEALEYNLAVRLAPEFGRQLDPMIWEEAKELKAAVMRQNTRPSYMKTDAPGMGKVYNILTGE